MDEIISDSLYVIPPDEVLPSSEEDEDVAAAAALPDVRIRRGRRGLDGENGELEKVFWVVDMTTKYVRTHNHDILVSCLVEKCV